MTSNVSKFFGIGLIKIFYIYIAARDIVTTTVIVVAVGR
jgi:hypothetical protein